jgi:hypothetical protein
MADKKKKPAPQFAPFALAHDRIEFEIQTEAGPATLTWEIGPATMTGAWAREDYRTAALAAIQETMDEPAEDDERPEWERMNTDQRRRWLFHLWTGSALAGATVAIDVAGEPLPVEPDTLITLPQAILEAAVTLAYKHNPNWRPGYAEDLDPN